MANLEISGVSVVLLGKFNPKIFQPAWFGAEGLLPKTETEQTEDLLVHSEMTVFKTPWLRLQASTERFTLTIDSESHEKVLRDLIVSTFTLLRHTPIKALGINVDQHWKFETPDKWNAFGDALAPKEVWRGFMKDPGLLKLTMLDKEVRKSPPGSIRVDVEGSNRVQPGVYAVVNNHFEWSSLAGAAGAISVIENHFDSAIKEGREIIKKLISICN